MMTYEVRHSGRIVSTRNAPSAREAAMDYVRSLGCKRDEITSLAGDAVAWRGAVYRAALAETQAPDGRRF
jgi:hypothetical protein